MAEKNAPSVYRTLMFAGLADVCLGLVLVVLGLTGALGEPNTLLAGCGGLFAVIGVGLVIWARNKLSQADDRRGDLN